MEAHRRDIERSRQDQTTPNEANKTPHSGDASQPTRRDFFRYIGSFLFGATLVDRTARQVLASPPCQYQGDQDDACDSPGDNDQGCGYGNTDEGCTNSGWWYNEDQNCAYERVGGKDDNDGACGVSNDEDNACHRRAPGIDNGDEDQSCTQMSGPSLNEDQGCGDCNDNHDKDNNCGESLGGSTVDSDQMCGHAHTSPWGGDADNNCKVSGNPDSGCGSHNGPVGNDWTDPDQGCQSNPEPPPADTDLNCTGEASDSKCEPGAGNTSIPDEHCSGTEGSYDRDQACEEFFDEDEVCSAEGNTDVDEGCGGEDRSGLTSSFQSDPDQNCAEELPAEGYDEDSQCGLRSGSASPPLREPDDGCGTAKPGGGTDDDDRCGKPGYEDNDGAA